MHLLNALLREDPGVHGNKASDGDRVRDELVEATCDRAFFVDTGPVRERNTFDARAVEPKVRHIEVPNESCSLTGAILAEYQALLPRLRANAGPSGRIKTRHVGLEA